MNLRKHAIAIVFICIYALVGFTVYDDYGISWDEPLQREYGEAVYHYVVDNDTLLFGHPSRYHGPVFQSILFGVETLTGTKETTFKIRHLITFCIALLGCWFFYLLLLQLGFKPHWAAFGMAMLICSPCIFAHSFYNSKDAVFMHVFIVCMYLLVRFIERPKMSWAVALGICTGILIDIRILGLFVPVFALAFWGLESLKSRDYLLGSLLPDSVLALVSILTMVAGWPTLWHDPVGEFLNALARMGDYPWDDPVLFSGAFVIPKELPWFYLPEWMLVSTPIFISILAGIGLITALLRSGHLLWKKLLPFIWITPIVIIVLKGATVYDGWRHVFFIYPAFLILAVASANLIFDKAFGWRFSKWIPFAFLIMPVSFIIKAHPHQQVYFNPLVMKNAFHNYEMDYWGLSYKQALEYVMLLEPEGELRLSVANSPGFFNHYSLPKKDRDRIIWKSRDSADIFISNFRFPSEHEKFLLDSGKYSKPLLIIEVEGNPIVGVFDLRN